MNRPFPLRRKDDALRRRRLRRGMYLLPSLFTTINIAAGYYSISQSVQGVVSGSARNFDLAAMGIGFAILADGLDGRIARLTNTTSEFGKQLDSLADVITFGIAPAILAWLWGFRMLPEGDMRSRLVQLGAIATFSFLVAGASRLARFNIQVNPQPSNPGRPGKKYFVGMPIPAGAGVIASVVHFTRGGPLHEWWLSAIWMALIVATGFLMVSTWRFPSFKEIDLRQRHPFWVIIFIGLTVAAIWYFSQYVLFFMALTYMLSGVLARLSYILRRHGGTSPPAIPEATEAQ